MTQRFEKELDNRHRKGSLSARLDKISSSRGFKNEGVSPLPQLPPPPPPASRKISARAFEDLGSATPRPVFQKTFEEKKTSRSYIISGLSSVLNATAAIGSVTIPFQKQIVNIIPHLMP